MLNPYSSEPTTVAVHVEATTGALKTHGVDPGEALREFALARVRGNDPLLRIRDSTVNALCDRRMQSSQRTLRAMLALRKVSFQRLLDGTREERALGDVTAEPLVHHRDRLAVRLLRRRQLQPRVSALDRQAASRLPRDAGLSDNRDLNAPGAACATRLSRHEHA
jgi:hypothetical protein